MKDIYHVVRGVGFYRMGLVVKFRHDIPCINIRYNYRRYGIIEEGAVQLKYRK